MKNIKDLFIKASAVLAALGLVLVSSPVAHAQYTGTNGRIITYATSYGAVSFKPDGTNYYGHNIDFVNTGNLKRQYVYSPDGTKIAYTVMVDDNTANLYVKPAGSTNAGTQVTTAVTGMQDGNPYFSPDGTKIAFVRYDTAAVHHDVFVVGVDGSGLTQLTKDMTSAESPQSVGDPVWKSDGSEIYVSTATIANGFGIYSIDPATADQSTATPIATTTDGMTDFNGHFDISPDGTKFIYQSRPVTPSISYSVRSINFDGTGDSAVLSADTNTWWYLGSYSPDGTKIVVLKYDKVALTSSLVVTNADGSSPTTIVAANQYGFELSGVMFHSFWGTNQDTYPDNGSLGGFDTPTVPNTASSFIAKAKSNPLAIAVSTLAVLGLIALGSYWVRTELKKKR